MKSELQKFLKEYEKQTNTHDFENVRPLIAPDAVYWFSNGTHKGIRTIEKAFVKTWGKIREESYRIENVQWLVASEKMGVCIYNFYWRGKVNGKIKTGSGRGTNVILKQGGRWQIVHEHLSNK